MKNKKIIKSALALLCALTLLVGGLAGTAIYNGRKTGSETSSMKDVGTGTTSESSVIKEQLETAGYTEITPGDYGITEETVHTNQASKKLLKSYYTKNEETGSNASGAYFHKKYLNADLYISTGGSNYAAVSYLGADVLRIYFSNSTFYLYSKNANKTLVSKDFTSYGVDQKKYFNVKLATDMVVGSSKTEITVQLWLNDQPITLTNSTISVDNDKLTTSSLRAELNINTGTTIRIIKIKPPTVTAGDTSTVSPKLDGYTKITPEAFGIDKEVTHTYSDATINQQYSGSTSLLDTKTYFDADVSITPTTTAKTGGYIAYLNEWFLRIYVINTTLYVYSLPGEEVVYQTNLSALGIGEGDYFNLRLATNMVDNTTDSANTNVTFQMWINGGLIVPQKATVTVSDGHAGGTNFFVGLAEVGTIKVKPAGWVEPEEPEIPSDENIPEGLKGYTKIGPEDFNITDELEYTSDGTTGTGFYSHQAKNVDASNKTYLDKKYFEADVSLTNYNGILNSIQPYGSGNFMIMIRYNLFSVYSEKADRLLYETKINDLNISAGEYFNLKLATDVKDNADSSKTDVTFKIWVNDKLVTPMEDVSTTDGVTLTLSDSAFTNTMNVGLYAAGTIKIKPVVEESVEPENPDTPEDPDEPIDPNLPEELKGYKKVTPADFKITKATTYTYSPTWSNKKYSASSISSFDKTYFEADVSLTEDNSINNSIRYLGNEQFTFYIGWNVLRVYHYAVEGGVIYEVGLATAGITPGEYFNLKVATDISDNADTTKTDITVRIWVNDTMITPKKLASTVTNATSDTTLKTVTITDSDSKIDNTLRVTMAKAGTIRIKTHVDISKGEGERLSDVSYELASTSGYLLTGSGDLFVDGVATDVGTVLTKPGDYVIQNVISPDEIYIQTVSLYKVGDVNLGGGVEWTADDQGELERIIKNGSTSNAAKKAADINNDGKVDKRDLTLIKKVVKGTMEEDEVIAKYHAPAVTYDFLGGDTVMPIGGYYGPYNDQNITESVYKAIKKSGINLIVKSEIDYVNKNEQVLIERGLEYGEKYGIGTFVYDTRLNSITVSNDVVSAHNYVSDATKLASLLGDYSKYESYLGNMIVDEPIANIEDGWENQLENRPDRFKWYEGITTALNSYDNQMGYVNLLGQYHMQKTDGTYVYMDYEAYLRTIGKSTKLLSFDSYPFWEKSLASGGKTPYLKSLGIISKVAREDGYPFWSYIQAGTDYRDTDFYGETTGYLTQAQTMWNVNTSLAFGAKGIVYFPLVQPKYFSYVDETAGTYDYNRNGIFGANNETNIYYPMVSVANKQVQAVDEVLMKSVNQGVIVTGQAVTDTADVESIIASTDKLKSVSGDDAMVGCFTYGDTEAFYAVSYDYDASEKQTITLKFDGNHQYRLIQNGVTSYGEGSTCTITASAGEGALIVLEDCVVYYDDISVYRTENGYTAPEAPAGYIFAGWYKDKACTKGYAVKKGETEVGAYAKFVDAKLLTVQAQITAGTKVDSTSTNIRFLAAVNDLNYRKVGFKINIHKASGIVERNYANNVVYDTLTALVGDEEWKYKPSDLFGGTATYFKAQIIKNVPKSDFDVSFEVTPYWETLDGTTVYGATEIKTVRQGIE